MLCTGPVCSVAALGQSHAGDRSDEPTPNPNRWKGSGKSLATAPPTVSQEWLGIWPRNAPAVAMLPMAFVDPTAGSLAFWWNGEDHLGAVTRGFGWPMPHSMIAVWDLSAGQKESPGSSDRARGCERSRSGPNSTTLSIASDSPVIELWHLNRRTKKRQR